MSERNQFVMWRKFSSFFLSISLLKLYFSVCRITQCNNGEKWKSKIFLNSLQIYSKYIEQILAKVNFFCLTQQNVFETQLENIPLYHGTPQKVNVTTIYFENCYQTIFWYSYLKGIQDSAEPSASTCFY